MFGRAILAQAHPSERDAIFEKLEPAPSDRPFYRDYGKQRGNLGPKGVYECTGDFGYLRQGRNKQLHALFYHKVDKIYFPMHCDCATEVELKGQLKAAYPRWKKKMTEREAKVCTIVCSLFRVRTC